MIANFLSTSGTNMLKLIVTSRFWLDQYRIGYYYHCHDLNSLTGTGCGTSGDRVTLAGGAVVTCLSLGF
ncbi:hypothetical protein [Aliterella atlantica]|uniref:hypothetical protein n=1 Tax=Aliterella atlantica TaxID=1827278 RepID=UPI001F1FD565|nr:hypothetical protein [Aliterella atlantica]